MAYGTPAAFVGSLNANEIYSGIYNMIISQQVFGSPIKGVYGDLVELFRRDGSLFGDTKLFYSVQIGKVESWSNDSEASNLLGVQRPTAPACQKVVIDTFKKIWLTVDNFLSKRAWGDENTFAQFTSVILGTIRDTKKVFEASEMNTFVGTTATATGNQTVTITLPTSTGEGVTDEGTPVTTTYVDAEELARLEGQTIAKAIADLIVDIKDVNAKYNDNGYLRSYDIDDLVFVWNADYYNKITKLDLPTIFHKDGLVDKLGEYVLPGHYFGTVNDATKTTADSNTRALGYQTISSTDYFAGMAIPTGTTLASGGTISAPSYQEDGKVICKIIHKDAIQYMSGFETETEFFNPRALTNSHYLIFGYSELGQSRLKEFPFITVKTA